MADPQTVIEGTLKYRDNKKWKPRWCVIRKLSPVADCLHLQLYRDSKDRCKNGPTKASLSLEGFLGMETGFTLDKESNTMALICSEVVVVLAFDSRELLIQWQVKVRANLLEEHQFLVQIAHVPPRSKLASGPARLHLLDYLFCLTAGVPPKLLGIWPLKELRRFGVVDGKFCFEGGSRCNKGEGLHVLLTNQAKDLVQAFDMASRGRLPGRRKVSLRKTTGSTDGNSRSSLQSRSQGCCNTGNDDKTMVTCSTESPAKLLLSSSSDGSELGTTKRDKDGSATFESHIRPCHMHYRWPSCIVPCGAANREGAGEDAQHRPIVRSSVGPHGQMLWAVGHCQGCSVHYCRRSSNEKERTPLPQEVRFGEESSGFTPQWTMDLNVVSPSKENTNNVNTRTTNRNRGKAPHDRSSLCSQSSQSSGTSTGSNASSSSSSSSISEYSVPKNCIEGFYDRPKNVHHPVHPYNRLSHPEDNSKIDITTPSGMRGNLGPIQESAGIPPCTCWNQRHEQQQQDLLFVGNDLLCTCWNRGQRNSADMDMPSFSSSGSSNVSPSTSPKKQPSFVGVPILLPCTCGKANNNPYLNYAVPRSTALVKDVKDGSKDGTMCRNITEADTATDVQEIKIINKMDNSTSSLESSEDNGNKLSNNSQPKNPEPVKSINIPQQQVCPCQRLLLCPPSFLPPSWNRPLQPSHEQQHRQNSQTNAEYASVSKKPICRPPPDSSSAIFSPSENENQKRKEDQNLNFICRQNPWVCNLPGDCCGSKMSAGVPVMNTWKKDNANHIYVNLKYLQETAATVASTPGATRKLIPYYANLYFLQTLSLYENAGLLSIRPSNLFPGSDPTASGSNTDDSQKTEEQKKKSIPKKRMELPTNNGVYEMMSFNREESPSASSDNYMLMQPGVHPDLEETSENAVLSCESSVESGKEAAASGPAEISSFESTTLPLRPFMPVLLPFHEHVCEHKDNDGIPEEECNKHDIVKRCCSQDGNCRSSRSNSLGDLKISVLRRGRSSSTDGRQLGTEKTKEDSNVPTCCSSPKSTPIRKHPILTKLTFKSKEKSFSTDEITPPSTAPSSPDSMFLENIQKYPFHRSADCLQLNEEYRLSEEDLSQDPDVIMSQSMDKGRSTLSIKRSSSVPCKGNQAQQAQSNSGDGSAQSHQQPVKQAAVFSHFIAYHGSLPRRCSGNGASRHPLIDRKKPQNNPTQDQVPHPVQEQRSNSDPSNLIFISECKQCHQFVTSPEGLLVLDAKSMTSSSSSDMSDYIESLSLCSRSSSGSGSSGVGGISGSEYIRTEEIGKLPTSCTSSLRPRSGKEYHSFDRVVFQDGCPYIPVADCSHLTLPCLKPFLDENSQVMDPGFRQDRTGDMKSFKSSTSTATKTNSPSPGYVSSSPGNPDFASPEKGQHFSFPKESKDLNYLEVVSVNESEPTSPVIKSGTVQYAVIDVVATAAAKKLGAERAQLREGASPTPTNCSPKHTTEDSEK